LQQTIFGKSVKDDEEEEENLQKNSDKYLWSGKIAVVTKKTELKITVEVVHSHATKIDGYSS
jgi:hypothetical protein